MTKEESWDMIVERNQMQGCGFMTIPIAQVRRLHDAAFERGEAHGVAQAASRIDVRPTDDLTERTDHA